MDKPVSLTLIKNYFENNLGVLDRAKAYLAGGKVREFQYDNGHIMCEIDSSFVDSAGSKPHLVEVTPSKYHIVILMQYLDIF